MPCLFSFFHVAFCTIINDITGICSSFNAGKYPAGEVGHPNSMPSSKGIAQIGC